MGQTQCTELQVQLIADVQVAEQEVDVEREKVWGACNCVSASCSTSDPSGIHCDHARFRDVADAETPH